MADAVIAKRLDVAEWAMKALAQLWAFTDPYDGASMKAFVGKAVRVMAAAQTSVAKTTTAAQVAQLAAQGIVVPPVVPSNPVDVRAPRVAIVDGVAQLDRSPVEVTYKTPDAPAASAPTLVNPEPASARSDVAKPARRPRAKVTVTDSTPRRAAPAKPRARVTVVDSSTPTTSVKQTSSRVQVTIRDSSTAEVLNRPARAYRYQKSIGASEKDAQDVAAARLRTIVDDNLMLAQRLAEAEALAQAADLDDRVIGYRRIVHPELSRGGVCGMCLVASDRIYKISDLKPIHEDCCCTVAAVTKDHDPGGVNADDLKRFYEDAKGTNRESLKRTRYKVDEHGELGAVLVPKAEHRSRAQRAEDRAQRAAEQARTRAERRAAADAGPSTSADGPKGPSGPTDPPVATGGSGGGGFDDERAKYRATPTDQREIDQRFADPLGDVVDAHAQGDSEPLRQLAEDLSGNLTTGKGDKFHVEWAPGGVGASLVGDVFLDGKPAGQIIRQFRRTKDKDNKDKFLVVDNQRMVLDDAGRGKGFASAIGPQLEDYYRRSGVDVITVHAGLDNGGYTWARQNFAWNRDPDTLDESLRSVRNQITLLVHDRKEWPRTDAEKKAKAAARPIRISDADKAELTALLDRLQVDAVDLPDPRDLAGLKGSDGELGRKLMVRTGWHGVKTLTEKGKGFHEEA